jgi:hypothetical protein
MNGAPIAHETNMMISHVVLLLPVEPEYSYSWRWKTSMIIQIQKASDAIAKTRSGGHERGDSGCERGGKLEGLLHNVSPPLGEQP